MAGPKATLEVVFGVVDGSYYIFMTVFIGSSQVSEKTLCFNNFQDVD